jgi:hypothetical protein
MARPKVKTFIDFDDTSRKRNFMNWIGRLKGLYELRIEPRRDIRTTAQNRLWWSQVVEPFYEFLKDQDYEIVDPEQAHSLLKEKFLRVPVVNKGTGEEIGWRTRSTTELTVEEFSDLVERSTVWLAEMFGVVVLSDRTRETA